MRVLVRGLGERGRRALSTGLFEETRSFADLGASPALRKELEAARFVKPTRVQADSFAVLRQGRDAILLAETGSGKTLAYLSPVLDALEDGDRVLILAPTQELVQQIAGVVESVFPSRKAGLRACYGSLAPPRSDNFEVLVATPKALAENLHPSHLESLRTVILDEADLLLSGDYAQYTKDGILRKLRQDEANGRPHTQVVFAAATLPAAGTKSIRAYLDRFHGDAELIATHGHHRPRQLVTTSWIRVRVPEDRYGDEAALLAARKEAKIGFQNDPTPGQIAAHYDQLRHERERLLWQRKLWVLLLSLKHGPDALAQLGDADGLIQDFDFDGAMTPPSGLGPELTKGVPPTLVFAKSAKRAKEAKAFLTKYGAFDSRSFDRYPSLTRNWIL